MHPAVCMLRCFFLLFFCISLSACAVAVRRNALNGVGGSGIAPPAAAVVPGKRVGPCIPNIMQLGVDCCGDGGIITHLSLGLGSEGVESVPWSLGAWFLPVGVGGVIVVLGAYIVAAYRAR